MAISVADLALKELPKDDWIIEGLLTRRNTGFIMGPPKKGCKSWLSLAAAWNLSEGLPIWGIPELKPPRPMRSVYFTQEDPEPDIQKRVMANVEVGKRKPNDNIWIVPKNLNIKLDTPVGIEIVKRELDDVARCGQIDLVIFDPMRRIHDGEENDSTTIAKLWHRIEALHNDYGCATLITHHIAKPPNDREGYDPTDPYHGRGSGDIYGGGDAFVMVVPGAMAPDGKSWRRLGAYFESKRGEQIPPAELKVWLKTGQVEYVGKGMAHSEGQ
jgi:RecA-family ATPase